MTLTVNLTDSQIQLIQLNATNAFNIAFAPYNVNLGAANLGAIRHPRQGTNTVYIVGQSGAGFCGGTGTASITNSVAYYPENMTNAQYAVNAASGNPTQTLLDAIGEGLGNNAAHELGHQLVNNFLSTGKVIAGMDLGDSTPDTYNSESCSGSVAPWDYTGIGTDGKTPIHWESDADQSLVNILGRRK